MTEVLSKEEIQKRLDAANSELELQISQSTVLTRWIARWIVKSRYNKQISTGIGKGTRSLMDLYARLV